MSIGCFIVTGLRLSLLLSTVATCPPVSEFEGLMVPLLMALSPLLNVSTIFFFFTILLPIVAFTGFETGNVFISVLLSNVGALSVGV